MRLEERSIKQFLFSTMMEDKKLNSNIYNSNVLFNFLTYYVCSYLANEIFQFYIWYMWIWHWQVDIYTLRWKPQMACCMIASHKRREKLNIRLLNSQITRVRESDWDSIVHYFNNRIVKCHTYGCLTTGSCNIVYLVPLRYELFKYWISHMSLNCSISSQNSLKKKKNLFFTNKLLNFPL